MASILNSKITLILIAVFLFIPVILLERNFYLGDFIDSIFIIRISQLEVVFVYISLLLGTFLSFLSKKRRLFYFSFTLSVIYSILLLIGNGFTFGI